MSDANREMLIKAAQNNGVVITNDMADLLLELMAQRNFQYCAVTERIGDVEYTLEASTPQLLAELVRMKERGELHDNG